MGFELGGTGLRAIPTMMVECHEEKAKLLPRHNPALVSRNKLQPVLGCVQPEAVSGWKFVFREH